MGGGFGGGMLDRPRLQVRVERGDLGMLAAVIQEVVPVAIES
jgi:hypothetical protein